MAPPNDTRAHELPAEDVAAELVGTKLRIAEAALVTLKKNGFAGASAREIAGLGGFNQALIFYHFGSVQKALLAALDLVSARRMSAYRSALDKAGTIAELASLARSIYDEDSENGYIKVLGEMVSGGVSDAELGREVAARLRPWIELVALKLRDLLNGSPFESVLPADDIAFAIVALYLGVDMISHLQGKHAHAESLLDLLERCAPLLGVMLSQQPEGESK